MGFGDFFVLKLSRETLLKQNDSSSNFHPKQKIPVQILPSKFLQEQNLPQQLNSKTINRHL